ncbi:MAG: hypothetical protein ACC726_09055 [Chloroflexota bacterium]
MRFGDLEGLTSLPIDRVRHRFRHEDVLTVLPVSGNATGLTSLLVATSSGLAIVTADKDPESGHWSTRWEPWDEVRFTDEGEAAPDAPAQYDGYAVHIGALTFHAQLAGPAGARALRDFVIAAQARRAALLR